MGGARRASHHWWFLAGTTSNIALVLLASNASTTHIDADEPSPCTKPEAMGPHCAKMWTETEWNRYFCSKYCRWYVDQDLCPLCGGVDEHTCTGAGQGTLNRGCDKYWDVLQWKQNYCLYCKWHPRVKVVVAPGLKESCANGCEPSTWGGRRAQSWQRLVDHP